MHLLELLVKDETVEVYVGHENEDTLKEAVQIPTFKPSNRHTTAIHGENRIGTLYYLRISVKDISTLLETNFTNISRCFIYLHPGQVDPSNVCHKLGVTAICWYPLHVKPTMETRTLLL